MRSNLILSLLVSLCACKIAPLDTGVDVCLEECMSELKVELSEASDGFQVQVYGEDFMTLNLACPEGIVAGGPSFVVVECTAEGFVFEAGGYMFPTALTFSVDGGPEEVVEPNWVESQVCGTTCASAEVSL